MTTTNPRWREEQAARNRRPGRCGRELGGMCACWRKAWHKGPCRCTCAMYGVTHGVSVLYTTSLFAESKVRS
jgi:hypothetical protein